MCVCLCFRNIVGRGGVEGSLDNKGRIGGSTGMSLAPVVASGVARLEKDYVATFRLDRSLTVQPA